MRTASLLWIATLVMASVASGEGLKVDFGADERIRQEMMDNVVGLPGGGLLSRNDRGDFQNHVRFRTRVWGEISGESEKAGKWRIYTRLTDECRWYITRNANEPYSWPDEIFLDNLFVEGKELFDGVMDIAVGRQDIMQLYGLDHVFMDGTPGDGSRSVYSDMVRMGFQITDESRLDIFALYNFDDNALRWGTERGKHRSMCGLGGAEVDMDDWGYGAVWSSKMAPWLDYQLFALQKNTEEYIRKESQRPWTRREVFGAKAVPHLNEEWSLQIEGMGQVGKNGEGAALSGWSSYAGINWKSTRNGVKPFGKLGYHFMSGDKDAAKEDGGNHAWDPIWARAVNDSEQFLYGTHYGVARWSNMHYVKLTMGVDFGAHHRVTGSCGPMFSAAQDHLGGGDGDYKGFLSQLRYDIPIWIADKGKGERFEVFGHIIGELFNPGDYYASEKPAWFLRWQVELKF